MIVFNIKQWETFLWVAALGSFRKTAEKLNATQPAISHRITNLENIIGEKLFIREGRAVKLTAKGQQIYPQVQQFLKAAEKLQTSLLGDDKLTGVFRLGVSETITHTWLPSYLAEFHKKFPAIDVALTVDVTLNLSNELLSKGIDLAFLMGPVSEYRTENIPLPSFPLVWAASPKLNIDADKPLNLQDLSQYPIVTYARNTKPYMEIYRAFSNHSDTLPRIFPSSSLSACLRMVTAGIGIGSLPLDMIQQHIQNNDLVVINCDWTPSALHFTASFPDGPVFAITQLATELAVTVAEEYSQGKIAS